MKRTVIAYLALSFALASGCATTTAHDEYETAWSIVHGGREIVDGGALARAFGVPVDCTRTQFQNIRRHDDRLGCLSCLGIDVTPISNCQYKVGTIYLTIARATRDSALFDSRRYIEAWRPSGSTEEIQQIPTSSQTSSMSRIVYRKGDKTYEVSLQVWKVKREWIAASTLFQY